MDQRLETFLTVCATMNYRKAAEQLHLTQPAVTKQIQALEALYGVRLFTSARRRVRKPPMRMTDAHLGENPLFVGLRRLLSELRTKLARFACSNSGSPF